MVSKIDDDTMVALWDATATRDDRVIAFGRAVEAEAAKRETALIAALKTHAGDTNGWEFGLGRVKFGPHGALESFLWATQEDIDAAIAAALTKEG